MSRLAGFLLLTILVIALTTGSCHAAAHTPTQQDTSLQLQTL